MRYLPYTEINLRKFLRNGLILDTGVLYLFLIGYYDQEYNHSFLIKEGYQKEDFRILTQFISTFGIKDFIITPYILTQFYSRLRKHLKQQPLINDFFNKLSPALKEFVEMIPKKDKILQSDEFKRFEIGDTSLILVIKSYAETKDKSCLITSDRSLASFYNRDYHTTSILLEDLKSFQCTFN